MDCVPCSRDSRLADEPLIERIGYDEHWRVAHAVGTDMPGWLVLIARRHVTTVAGLTDAEAAALGTWQVRLSRALHDVLGVPKTYVAEFMEAARYEHVHFHLIPRPADLPAAERGPAVFAHLGLPGTTAEAESMAAKIQAAL